MSKQKYEKIGNVEIKNRRSAVYFFVTAITALIIFELFRFLVRVTPVESRVYYQISIRWELLPQTIVLAGSVFLLFDFYRRIWLFFEETYIGQIITVVLAFLVLFSIYRFGFIRPNDWVCVVGFNLLVGSFKVYHSRYSLKKRLPGERIEKIELIKEMKRWIIRTFLYGVFIFIIGILFYTTTTKYHVSPILMDILALILFTLLAGGNYYYSLTGAGPLFSPDRMDKLREYLQNMYEEFEKTGA